MKTKPPTVPKGTAYQTNKGDHFQWNGSKWVQLVELPLQLKNQKMKKGVIAIKCPSLGMDFAAMAWNNRLFIQLQRYQDKKTKKYWGLGLCLEKWQHPRYYLGCFEYGKLGLIKPEKMSIFQLGLLDEYEEKGINLVTHTHKGQNRVAIELYGLGNEKKGAYIPFEDLPLPSCLGIRFSMIYHRNWSRKRVTPFELSTPDITNKERQKLIKLYNIKGINREVAREMIKPKK